MTAAVHDLADLQRAEAALYHSEQRLTAVLDSVSDGFLAVDAAWRITEFNRASEQALGIGRGAALGQLLWDVAPAMQSPAFVHWLCAILASGEPGYFEADGVLAPGGRAAFRALPRAEGGIALAFSDITETRRAEQQRQVLVNELNHRVKNTLATVQAIAAQSFRPGTGMAAARQAFEGRLATLAAAHTLLTARNWERAPLADVIAASLPAGGAERVHLSGPDVRLPPQTAVLLALAVHELATNACCHGALYAPEGRVDAGWRIRADDEGCLRLQLEWRESGGPPVVQPVRRGFGTRLLEQGLAHELRGKVDLAFAPAGLVCRIDMPLPEAG